MTPLGIIAGRGRVPFAVADAARAAGRDVFVAALAGFATHDIDAFPHRRLPPLAIGALVAALKEKNCRELVLVGGVARPDLSAAGALKDFPDGLLRRARRVVSAPRGDNVLISELIGFLEEEEGFRVLAPDAVCDALRVREGHLAGPRPKSEHEKDIALAAEASAQIAALDIGQAAIAAGGNVLAVEAAEGTDAMMRRIAELPPSVRARGGVLVKRPRPHQDRRVDLPAIGPDTLKRAEEIALAGIAVEAGGALICERDTLFAQADKAGIFIIGISRGEDRGGLGAPLRPQY